MTIIRCPNCNSKVLIDIAKALDEHGEVYMCPNCKWKLRYVDE